MINIPFLNKKEEIKEYFLALLVKPFSVGAILFEEVDSKLLILSTNEVKQSKEVDSISAEDLVVASDKVISFVESSLPQNSKLEKTIFSVPHSWVVEGKIQQEYLSKFKKTCVELGLVPMGFIVSIEAIVNFLKQKEGAPVSAIFIEVASSTIFVYLVRSGKIIEVKKGKIENNLVSSAENLLKEIEKVDVLPPKIILLDHEDVDNVQQEFLSHQWSKDIPFLHLPQVVVLEKGFENEAIINGVANQMGFEVLQDIKAPHEQPGVQGDILEEVENGEEFGFFKEKDVAHEPVVEQQEETVDDEIAVTPKIGYFKEEDGMVESEKKLPSIKIPAIFLNLSKNIFGRFGRISFRGMKMKTNIIGIAAAAIVLIIGFIFVYYNFILKANVIIFADQKNIEKNEKVTFSVDSQDPATIKLSIDSQEVSGDVSKEATGKKETGDKAKGEVVVYNKTDAAKTFKKGTVIIGTNDLEFVLTEDIAIASTSAFSTTLTSSKVKVEASKFGKEYNLPSSTNFTVKSFSTSDFIAKNNDAFSGGTKKETKVVSQKDLDDLLSSATSDLEKKALENARGKAGEGNVFLTTALSSEIVEKKYNKKEGDEAEKIGLSAKIKYQLGSYNKNDLNKTVEALTKSEVPEGYALQNDKSNIEVKNIKVAKDSSAVGELSINAVYAPGISTESLIKTLKGKSAGSVKKDLEKIKGISEVQIEFKGKLPLLPSFLPLNTKNISVEKKS